MHRRPRGRRALALSIVVLATAAVGGTLLLAPRGAPVPLTGTPIADGTPLLVYAEFGMTADRIFTAPAGDPARRTLVDTVEHAPGWGIHPAAAPAGSRVAFLAVPPGGADTGSDAEVWLLDVERGERRRLAGDADLLAQPRFDAAGATLVYRRTTAGNVQALMVVDLERGTRRVAHEEPTDFGLYPIGFQRDGALVFARLSPAGTDILRVPGSAGGGEPELLIHASDSVARDWRLSPDGRRVSYLAPEIGADRAVYRVRVAALDDAPRAVSVDAPAATEQYGPTWTPDGAAIAFGREATGAESRGAAIVELEGEARLLAAPARGFDVPLAFSDDGGYLAVRSFDGSGSHAPGRESLVVVGAESGERLTVLGDAELIFIGWIGRA